MMRQELAYGRGRLAGGLAIGIGVWVIAGARIGIGTRTRSAVITLG